MNKNMQGLPLTYIKAVQLRKNIYGKPEPTDVVQAFTKGEWDKMRQLKDLNWMYVEEIPQPYPNDILKPEKTGGSEMIAYKSFENEKLGKLEYKGK